MLFYIFHFSFQISAIVYKITWFYALESSSDDPRQGYSNIFGILDTTRGQWLRQRTFLLSGYFFLCLQELSIFNPAAASKLV